MAAETSLYRWNAILVNCPVSAGFAGNTTLLIYSNYNIFQMSFTSCCSLSCRIVVIRYYHHCDMYNSTDSQVLQDLLLYTFICYIDLGGTELN